MKNTDEIKIIIQKKNSRCNHPYCKNKSTQSMILNAENYGKYYEFKLGAWSKCFSIVSSKMIKILSCDEHLFSFDANDFKKCQWYTKEIK